MFFIQNSVASTVENRRVSRPLFDVGLLTNQRDAMLQFWRDEMGFPLERELQPVEGVPQYKLNMKGAVLKLDCLEFELPKPSTLNGLRMLLVANADIDKPRHLCDPDGNLVCLVPPGYRGIQHFGVHYAVSNEENFHQFFRDVLQLPPLIGDYTYDFAGAPLSFAWSPEVVALTETTGRGYSYLTFQVIDAVQTHAEVCSRGATEERPPSSKHTTTDSTISFILDPDGNRIEISQRPDLVAAALQMTAGQNALNKNT